MHTHNYNSFMFTFYMKGVEILGDLWFNIVTN